MSVEDYLDYNNWSGNARPLWVAPFPRHSSLSIPQCAYDVTGFWSSCCLGLPTVMDCNLELWAAISPSHPQLLLSVCFYYDNRKRSPSRTDCFVVDRYCFYSVYSLIVIVAAQRAQFTGKDWEWNTGLIEVNTISSLLWSSYSCTSQVLLLKEER